MCLKFRKHIPQHPTRNAVTVASAVISTASLALNRTPDRPGPPTSQPPHDRKKDNPRAVAPPHHHHPHRTHPPEKSANPPSCKKGKHRQGTLHPVSSTKDRRCR
ncbi:hypothetical protein P167DRAFT_536995 [Morchella conica CCBAS932]|uniref:Uncharacterized protein n=1 Tax=Morchella conica CCBAS932 TaxID=1392247 RepID=A0A3N4KL16_9PEZI|nr:hypothetical protein P167DRAFT_536995 [Morchella conica CCBAS932]